MPVAEPHKELRFTRAGQAAGFWIGAAVAAMAGLVFLLLIPYRSENPELPHPAWSSIPITLALVLARLAWHCSRHAYILLSPIGIEIFPFFRPGTNLQVVPWAQIADAEIDDSRLTLHFNPEKTSGIHLSLAPLSRTARPLLAAAIRGRMSAGRQSTPLQLPS